MARTGKFSRLLLDLHIPLADLSSLSASDLLAIDGPKFITSDSESGARTYAVLISHDKWRMLNHGLPEVDPHRATVFHVGEHTYLAVPVYAANPTCFQAKPETGLEILTRRKSRKKVSI